jgi:hypothetical protein
VTGRYRPLEMAYSTKAAGDLTTAQPAWQVESMRYRNGDTDPLSIAFLKPSKNRELFYRTCLDGGSYGLPWWCLYVIHLLAGLAFRVPSWCGDPQGHRRPRRTIHSFAAVASACVQVVQEKHRTKRAGVAGRRLRALREGPRGLGHAGFSSRS